MEKVSAVDKVKERALALDAPGLEAALRGMGDGERAEVRDWVLKDKEFFASVREQEPQIVSSRDRAAWALIGSGVWMRIMCLVAVCSPAEAARAIRWGDVWAHMQPYAREHAAVLLADQTHEWAQTFLTTTAGVRLSTRDADVGGWSLAWFVFRGLEDHDLPCPDGRAFLQHCGQYSHRDPGDADRFLANRLNPDLVYLKIAAGFAAHYSGLHEAVTELVGARLLDRKRLIEVCLQTLITRTSVSSQRAVAKILTALDLRPAEIPGGLGYLTGVVATSDGSVGAALLPLALETAVARAGGAPDAGLRDGLEELARVVGGRKERKQKDLLLTWLRAPATRAEIGEGLVLASLEILAAGQEDAALLSVIETARAALGAPDDPAGDSRQVLGLWHLDLDPGPLRQAPEWMRPHRGFGLRTFLNRHREEYKPATEYYVDGFVHALADDTFVDLFVALCKQHRVDGSLAVTRCARLLEAGFLAGGLRILWPAALGIADDVASAGRTPGGLPDLLRLLTRYAPEVPDGWALPPHLTRLAAASGSSRSQFEARVLGAILTRGEANSCSPDPTAAPPVETRGLWKLRPPGPVLGRLLDPRYPMMYTMPDAHLPYVLGVGNGLAARRHGPPDGHRLDIDLVWELARRVQTGDLDTVRALCARSPRLPGSDEGPTCEALELWQSGRLTRTTLDDVLVGDRGRGPALDRVVFAWTCEQLVRLPTHPGLLSHPSLSDGTLLVPDLVHRLRSFAGVATVGPLDLLLTLTRVSVAPGEIGAALELLGAVPSVWTDPEVTRTSTGAESFDILPVIRACIAGGGMTVTSLAVDLDLFTGIAAADLRGPASHEDVAYRVWPRQLHPPESRVGAFSGDTRIELDQGRLPAEAWARLLAGVLHHGSATREASLEHLRELARFDSVLDRSVTVPTALTLLAGGDLALGRFTDALQWLFERGGLRQLWALGLAVAAAASEQTPKPVGLAALLTGLTSYAPEVPCLERSAPPEIVALASAATASKSRAAAQALVAALGQGERSNADPDGLARDRHQSGSA